MAAGASGTSTGCTSTATLAAGIWAVLRAWSTPGGKATYHVSWNPRKAPHGHLVEWGHLQRYEVSRDPKTDRFITHRDKPLATPRQVSGRPFIRPALAAKGEAAQQAMRDRYLEELRQRGVVR